MASQSAPQIYPRPIPQAPPLDGPVLMKDGTPAWLRPLCDADIDGVVDLLERSSSDSLYFRFFGAVKPGERLARSLIHPPAAAAGMGAGSGGSSETEMPEAPSLNLVVTIGGSGRDQRHIAIGSYSKTGEDEAEVAFLVEDGFQGKGLGSLLLERLAIAADAEGLKRLTAVVLPNNRKMLDIFKASGYRTHRVWDHGDVQIVFEIEPTRESVLRSEGRDHTATIASMRALFEPRSVAVFGVSRRGDGVGRQILKNLLAAKFAGKIYPINPFARTLIGLKAYPDLASVGENIDLAIVAVPAEAVMEVAAQCAGAGVRAMVVISAGFAETGPKGRALQDRLVNEVRGHGIRIVGPNCLGLVNNDPAVRLNALFTPVMPRPGHVAMSSQSGAVGLAVVDFAHRWGLGFSSFVSVGNKADVSGNDLLQYWEDDPNSDLILLYLESFGNPRRFTTLARRIARKKPIIAMKSGRSASGRRAAGSHTAALAGSDAVADSLFRQAGVIRTGTLEEMFEVASLLAHQPPPRGDRVGILSNSGGLAVICADALESLGLKLPEFGKDSINGLKKILPAEATVQNPLDTTVTLDRKKFARALALMLDDEAIDAVIVIDVETTARGAAQLGKAIASGREQAGSGANKPLLACALGRRGGDAPLRAGRERIPTYLYPESAARALAYAAGYARWLRKPIGVIPVQDDIDLEAGRELCKQVFALRGEGWLMPDEVDRLLRTCGIAATRTVMCASVAEAVAAADQIGYPVVVKLASATLVHKSQWHGVKLNVSNALEVRGAWAAMRGRLAEAGREDEMAGVSIQRMAEEGVEVMLGMTHDEVFGPIVGFGLGGVAIEVLRDVAFRITPLTDHDAIDLVRSIKGYALLDGFRGAAPCDIEALVDLVLRVSRMAESIHLIREIDLNPVRVRARGGGVEVLDARIRLKQPTA